MDRNSLEEEADISNVAKLEKRKTELEYLCNQIGIDKDSTYNMGKLEFSMYAASIFSELETTTHMELGERIMYSSLFAEIEALEKVREKILKYRDYSFWTDVARDKAVFILKKLESKAEKVEEYSKSMPLPSIVKQCYFWDRIQNRVQYKIKWEKDV